MMVNCLKCNSKINVDESWRARCIVCKNDVAFCKSCMYDDSFNFYIANCCKENKDYKMITL